jgi:aminocarboxymuconate-semialdehyde decarboxylase
MTDARTAIDIHAHFYPREWLALVEMEGAAFGAETRFVDGKRFLKIGDVQAGPFSPRFTEHEARIEAMDEQGVAMHALSLSLPMVYWAGPELSLRLSAAYNDAAADAHVKYPRRMFGLATLPMQAPALALQELVRAAQLPGMRGAYIATQIAGKELSDPAFFPVYEAIEALDWPIFLHPVEVIGHARLTPHYLTNLLGNPFESAIAAAHLIFGKVLDRFPKLVVVLPHAGGAFPWLAGRLHRGWEKRKDLQHVDQGPIEYLRRFYYDTVGYSGDVLDYLVRVIGADRIMMGSDYCFPIAYERPVEIVCDHPNLDDGTKKAITEVNARRLLRI